MFRRAFVFLVISCLTTLSFAQPAPTGSRSSEIYRQTFTRCSARYVLYSPIDLRMLRDGFAQLLQMSMIDTTAIGDFFFMRGQSPRLYEFLNSPDYALALQDCFGNDNGKKYLFVKTQMESSLDGQKAAVVAIVFVTRGAGALFGKVVTAVPKAKYVIYGVLATLTVRACYRGIHEVLRDPTPQEKVAGEKILAEPSLQADQIQAETRQLLRDAITVQIAKLKNTKAAPAQALIKNRIAVLAGHLKEIS